MRNLFMFVDDDDTFLQIAAHVCRRMESVPEPLFASDGVEALDALRRALPMPETFPQAIFVDVNMPRLDGFGFLDGLRHLREAHPELSAIKPVVMLTSSDQAQDRMRARALGADEYLVKPAGLARMRSFVSRFMT